MDRHVDPVDNYNQTMTKVGYIARSDADRETYARLGFKSGLEIHQQLKTTSKLFCRCPAGIYQDGDDYDAELVRHMRPTLSEMGEYDGTALMEQRTRKNIVYRIKNRTACTYEIDDTPPFHIDQEALDIAIEIALMLKTNIVGELHVARKQYLDGSIPTGFQRTGIIGIEGDIPLTDKTVRIIQLSIEEDSCREVSDVGHWRTYSTDRLGMPLIEMVTYPDMLTPDEVAEAGHYLRFLSRSSGKVRTGIGAGRQDVNVSITGGTRVEIKGVAHVSWIPNLTHVEAFRQKALLMIRDQLLQRIPNPTDWKPSHTELDVASLSSEVNAEWRAARRDQKLVAINLPGFEGILSHFTQPGHTFADELSGRLKVIACLDHPNLLHSESVSSAFPADEFSRIAKSLSAGDGDAQVVVWGPADDMETAIESITERCQLAFKGIPNETRKGLPDGTNIFERVLPGPNRMYPDTDSAPISIEKDSIEKIRETLPPSVADRIRQLQEWKAPLDTYHFVFRRNLLGLIEKIISDFAVSPRFVVTLFAHTVKCLEGRLPDSGFEYAQVWDLFDFATRQKLTIEIIPEMLPIVCEHPNMALPSVLTTFGYKPTTAVELADHIEILNDKFDEINTSSDPNARERWIMGRLRRSAIGNVLLTELHQMVMQEITND